jgi:hypothetical protein
MSSAVIPALGEWRQRVRKLEARCPWPGPRPLREWEDSLLVGRDEDKRDFVREVTNHRLLFLTGDSGVGKTSLLTAGLVPELRRNEYEVVVCRNWHGTTSGGMADFLAGKIREALTGANVVRRSAPSEPWATGAALFWELESELGGHMVIVLDQLEELLRSLRRQWTRRTELMELLQEINSKLKLRLVLSFRSEALLDLRWLENNARPFSVSRFVLAQIDNADEDGRSNAEKLALAGNKTEAPPAIDPEAARNVGRRWDRATAASRDAAADDSLDSVAMLQLQACLYVLHSRVAGRLIRDADVDAYAAEARSDVDLFSKALVDAIDVKLSRCQTASENYDGYLIAGATDVVARAVRHLSSGGFKLEREAFELAETTLADELDTLVSGIPGADPGAVKALFATVLDGVILSDGRPDADGGQVEPMTWEDIAAAADHRVADNSSGLWSASVAIPSTPSDQAKRCTAGPLMDQPPAVVLIEEFKRFAFALAWMQESTLVRISPIGERGFTVTLIHDGFGDALRPWSLKWLGDPQAALRALTAPRGAAFDWDVDERSGISKGNDAPRVISNLRWRGAGIQAHLRNAVFVNCDLRGAYFHHCTFDGVTFVNCEMEGVVIINSTITFASTQTPAPEAHARTLDADDLYSEPQFKVGNMNGVTPRDLADMAVYQQLRAEPNMLLSLGADRPAMVAPNDRDHSYVSWQPHSSGLAIYGGWVASLLLRDCDGEVHIRHATGSGFDIVEPRRMTLKLSDVAFRHLRVTAPFQPQRLEIDAEHSTLAHVWLGPGLSGQFTVTGGALVQSWNGADADSFTARADGGAKVHLNVGFELGECILLDGVDPATEGDALMPRRVPVDADFGRASRAMDFQFDHRDGAAAMPSRAIGAQVSRGSGRSGS